jgi:hypothetical protein
MMPELVVQVGVEAIALEERAEPEGDDVPPLAHGA